jgi:hypothetical protein
MAMHWSAPRRMGLTPAGFIEPCLPTRVDKPPAGLTDCVVKSWPTGSKRTQPMYLRHLEQGAVAEHSSPITAVPLISTSMPGNARWLIVTNVLAG